jgi:DNA-binding transcriptional regulator GbsR (MarR family)
VNKQQQSALNTFVQGWGRMGVYWGVGKVMAEIQAILYMSPRPLSLDEMSERLKTSRSNISLNVRALQNLGVVRKVIIPGDRKDYYTAEMEIEKVARRLAAVKKKRELDPALDIITRTIQAANGTGTSPSDGGESGESSDSIDTERLQQLKELMEKIGGILEMFIGEEAVDSGFRRTAPTQKA